MNTGGSNWRLELWNGLLPAPCVTGWESGLTYSGSFASEGGAEVDTVKLGMETRALGVWCSSEMSGVD